MKEIVLGITGASGAVYGLRMLQILKELGISTHLVITKWGAKTIELETGWGIDRVKELAHRSYEEDDLTAPIASGSYKTDGMVILPCSMKTLSAIAHGFSHNLITRAADVMLKEKRKLIIAPRETPLSLVHLENMLCVAKAGAIIMPPNPAFYFQPETIPEIIQEFAGRVLDLLGCEHDYSRRWGIEKPEGPPIIQKDG